MQSLQEAQIQACDLAVQWMPALQHAHCFWQLQVPALHLRNPKQAARPDDCSVVLHACSACACNSWLVSRSHLGGAPQNVTLA